MLIYLCLFLPPLMIGISLILKSKPDGEFIGRHPQVLVLTLLATLSPPAILFVLNLARLFDNPHSLLPTANVEFSGLIALGLISLSWGCLALGLVSAFFRK